MKLSRSFKKAVVKRFAPDQEGQWLFVTAIALSAAGGWGAASYVYEEPSTQPTALISHDEQVDELRQIRGQLAGIASEFKKVQEFDRIIKEAEENITKDQDVAAAREAIISARIGQTQSRFILDDKMTNFSAYAIMKTHLPERDVTEALAAVSLKWNMPQELDYNFRSRFRYRDEVRQEMPDLAGLSTREAVAKMNHEMENKAEGNNLWMAFSLALGGLGSGMGSMMGLFGLAGAFRKSLWREDEERHRREQEAWLAANPVLQEPAETLPMPPVAVPSRKEQPDRFRL